MSIIQAVSNTSGNARDVACDEAGRLLIAGVTVDLTGSALTVDLTSTNALLQQVVDSLDPTSGFFTVNVNNAVIIDDSPPIKVDIQLLDPGLLFPVTVNAFAPGSILDVNLVSTDPTLNIDVTITDITTTEPLHIIVDSFDPTAIVKVELSEITATDLLNVNIGGLDLTLFPDGFPIDIRNFSDSTPIPISIELINSTAFPNGIPVDLAFSGALEVTLDTSIVPLNVNIIGEPIDVTFTAPPGGLPVAIETTQFTNLLNTINGASVSLDAGTEVIIRDADGVLSDSNPLRTRGALLDSTGGLITTSNRLPVSAQLLGADGNPLSNLNPLLVTIEEELEAKVQVLTKNSNTMELADDTLQPLQVLSTGDLVISSRKYNSPKYTEAYDTTSMMLRPESDEGNSAFIYAYNYSYKSYLFTPRAVDGNELDIFVNVSDTNVGTGMLITLGYNPYPIGHPDEDKFWVYPVKGVIANAPDTNNTGEIQYIATDFPAYQNVKTVRITLEVKARQVRVVLVDLNQFPTLTGTLEYVIVSSKL